MFAAVLLTLSAPWLTLVSGFVVPLVTGLLTKYESSVGKKAVVTIVLSLVTGVLASVVSGNGVVDSDALLQALYTWGASLLVVFGLVGPLDVDSKLAPNWGLD